jgi:5-dehydro-2-deoxygluconokinase
MTGKSAETAASELDIITIGRASVDLYGQQIGSRLEDVTSFAKSVGGCPANIAVGTARLGLRSALLTRVGAEQMGRFIVEQLAREGVSTKGIVTDPQRLTALAILSVESDKSFPLLFYRDNCADSALCEDDIDERFIASARAVLVTGTHFAKPNSDAAQRKAMRIARENGGKVVLDIDYRPNLWGLASLGEGDNRYIRSDRVSARMKTVLPACDLIVGTEEEVLIASGETDLLAALRTIRSLTAAVIVLKRGPMGCIVYDGEISDDIDKGVVGEGFPIEVHNVLGAGDAFLSGFLRGWLGGENYETCATWANACGAFAVSRLLCSPEIPTFEELRFFLRHGSRHKALRRDEAINHVHWATTRRNPPVPLLMALACDHRIQFEQMADRLSVGHDRIAPFKTLAVKAAAEVAARRPGCGMLIDEKYGREALFEAARHPFVWIGRPVELPGSRPLRFEYSQDIGSLLVEWPVTHTIKCLSFYHPDDDAGLRAEQRERLRQLFDAARKIGRELLIEIIAGKNGPLGDDTVARALAELYEAGIRPDWWKLEPQVSRSAWKSIEAVIEDHDPWCRGIVLLGLEAPAERLREAFAACAEVRAVKGFAVGRSIFADAAEAWLSGTMTDADAIGDMARRFGELADAWLDVKGLKTA